MNPAVTRTFMHPMALVVGNCALAWLMMTLLATAPALAEATQQAAREDAPANAREANASLTVAVLEFDADLPAEPGFGRQISDVVTMMLSAQPGLRLVDRSRLDEVIAEHELNLAGLVDANEAIEVGRLVGARILVTGRAFRLGERVFIAGKLIGTETSLLEGVLVRGKVDRDPAELVLELADRLGERVRDAGPRLIAQPDAVTDPLPGLIEQLADRDKPVVAVVVHEEHIAARPAPQPPDPAVETELKRILLQAGFEIQDVKDNELANWARRYRPEDRGSWPRSLAHADYVVTGEGLSEFASRIGNLVSCSARAEINVIRRRDGRITLAERTTTRAVDLSEQIAGKKVLQYAGRHLAITVLEHFVDELPEAQAP